MSVPVTVAIIINITDPDALATYRSKAGSMLEPHGGSAIGVGKFAHTYEGDDAPGLVALLSFPSQQAADNWYNDPNLAGVHQLRREAGPTRISVLG